jgi:hypothetical protein
MTIRTFIHFPNQVMTKEPTTIPQHLLHQWLELAPGTPQDFCNAREVWLINHAYAAGVAHGQGARPVIHPVPVIERLPELEDCDAEGGCWWFDPHSDGAWYVDCYQGNYTHWLPANALARPKPPTLKEQALEQLRKVNAMLQFYTTGGETSAIRKALEALPND